MSVAYKKPTYPCHINWGHRLSKNLKGCYLLEDKVINNKNLINGASGTISGSPSHAIGLKGSSLYFPGTNDLISHDLPPLAANWSGYALMIIAKVDDALGVNRKRAVRLWGASGSTMHIEFSNSSESRIDSGIQYSAGLFDVCAGPAYSAGEYYTVIASWLSGDKVRMYVNNAQNIYISSTNRSTIVATSSINLGGNTSGSGLHLRGNLYTCYHWNRALVIDEVQELFANPYVFLNPTVRRFYSVPSGGNATFQASPQSITSSLQQQTPSVSFSPSALNITAILTTPTQQIIALSSALSAALSLQTSTISGASNKTVTASPLTVTLSQPSVTLSGSSTTTVNVACLTMTASIQTSVQKGTILPNSLATAMALITATEKVTLSPSSFSLIAVLNSVTFGGIQNRTILASALTANFTLFEPIVSQRYRSFLLHTKHNQPRYVNKVNAQRRIAKKNTVSGV